MLSDKDIHSILIVKLSAIGDIVMSMPVATMLRQRFPHAKIYWLTQPENKSLLSGNQDIDGTLLWDKKKWQQAKAKSFSSLIGEVKAFRESLKPYQFDLAVDMQGLLKSGFITRLSGARLRIGLASREGSQWLMHQKIPRGGDHSLISSEYRYFAEQLGLGNNTFKLDLSPHISQQDRDNANKLLQQSKIQQDFIALCPFTTRAQKHWVETSWPLLIDKLHQRYQCPLVILGGPADKLAAEKIAAKCQAEIHVFCGKTSLLEAAAVLEKTKITLGVDTGLTHMSIALHRPTLAIFGSTIPYSRTDNPLAFVSHSGRNCSPCRRNPTCKGRFDCMSDLTPAIIEQQVIALLESQS